MNNEILNKLIELGYVTNIPHANYINADDYIDWKNEFDAAVRASDFELVQRALFAECAKRGYRIEIENNTLFIFGITREDCSGYTGDTSRQSFLAAFKIVTGCK